MTFKITYNEIMNVDIESQGRLLAKKDGIYLETKKPNIFVRFWRRLSGQYDKCKIARKAVEIFTSQEEMRHAFMPQAKIRYFDGLQKIVNQIPKDKNNKYAKIYNSLKTQIDSLRPN